MLMNQIENLPPDASGQQAGLKIIEFKMKCNKKTDSKMCTDF